MDQQRHKAGPLKQRNKAHKDSRRGAKTATAKPLASIQQLNKAAKRQLSREERRNQAKQLRKQKREAVVSQRREFSDNGRPLICAIIPLSSAVDLSFVTESLRTADEAQSTRTERGYLFLGSSRVQQRIVFVPVSRDLYSIMDAAKCADVVLFVFASDLERQLDEFGEQVIACICAQGVPTAFGCVCALHSVRFDARDRAAILSRLERSVERHLPAMDGSFRTFAVDSPSEARILLQTIATAKLRKLAWRDVRPHLLVQKAEFQGDGDSGTLRCYGYVQGDRALSANQLVYVPGWHEYQMERLECLADPFPLRLERNAGRRSSSSLFDGLRVTRTCLPNPEKQEPLVEYATVAMESATDEISSGTSKSTAKTILKETFDGDISSEDASESESESDVEMDTKAKEDASDAGSDADSQGDDKDSDSQSEDGSEDLSDEQDTDKRRTVTFAPTATTSDAERREAEAYREARAREHEDEQFADEIDTPLDQPARERFTKYRGLATFKGTRWDPKESLPESYARLCEFQDYKHTRKVAMRDNRVEKQTEVQKDAPVAPGTFVCVSLRNVPRALFEEFESRAPSAVSFCLVGLLPHEAKQSVAHALVKRCNIGESPRVLPSRRSCVEMHVAFRRFLAKPVFSEQGAPRAAQFRMLRFFRRGLHCVASTFAPITYPPANVLFFAVSDRETDSSEVYSQVSADTASKSVSWRDHELLAVGTLMPPDPNRVVVKRVVLSGHPTKIRRRSATVRFMFFSAADVEWFKPVGLRTKAGASGHIREPLGTHGRMKCVFDRPIRSNDTVTMCLYKRTFPAADAFKHRVPFRIQTDSNESATRKSTAEEVDMDALFE